MYHTAYGEIFAGSNEATRKREFEALGRVIALFEAAQKTGFRSPAGATAIFQANRVWSFLIEDLSLTDNDLPDALRADLISLGIYVLKRLEALRKGDESAAADIIEVSQMIRNGLQ